MRALAIISKYFICSGCHGSLVHFRYPYLLPTSGGLFEGMEKREEREERGGGKLWEEVRGEKIAGGRWRSSVVGVGELRGLNKLLHGRVRTRSHCVLLYAKLAQAVNNGDSDPIVLFRRRF